MRHKHEENTRCTVSFFHYCYYCCLTLSASAIVSAQDNTDLCAADEVAEVAPSRSVRAMMLLNSLQTGDTTTIEAYVNPDTYIQHNLSVPDGRDALIAAASAVGS
jgi:hypothetical protein